jgi:hypothetical protein
MSFSARASHGRGLGAPRAAPYTCSAEGLVIVLRAEILRFAQDDNRLLNLSGRKLKEGASWVGALFFLGLLRRECVGAVRSFAASREC